MIKIIGAEVEGIRGIRSVTFNELLTVEVSYGKYKQKVTLPVSNLTQEELIEELRKLNADLVGRMREWEKIEQQINL